MTIFEYSDIVNAIITLAEKEEKNTENYIRLNPDDAEYRQLNAQVVYATLTEVLSEIKKVVKIEGKNKKS